MSEQQAEQSGLETGSLGVGPAAPNSSEPQIDDRLMASGQATRQVDSPKMVPAQDDAAKDDGKDDGNAFDLKAKTIKAGMPKAEPFTVEGFKSPKPDTPQGDAPQADGPRPDALMNGRLNTDTRETDAVKARATPRELLTMSPGERSWTRGEDGFENGHAAPKPDPDLPARGRRLAAMAAMLLLAVIAGAAGGALATIALSHPTDTAAATAPTIATLETAAVGRIDADIVALKAGLERTTSAALTQFNKTSDRLDRVEKAQAEPAAKLAKLSEAVDKLRAPPPAAAVPVAAALVAAKEVTGSITPPATTTPAAAPAAPPKPEVARLPTVEGWVLRDVANGGALIEGRQGLYEVFAGDPVPGLGRVDAIRRQDGRWVVVTSKGLIVAR